MKITYFGHSCFQVELNGKKILFDPFISPNPLAEKIKLEEIMPDYIVLSHGHGDHVADVEQIYRQSQAVLVANFEVVSWFQKKGLERVHPMNHGGKKKFDFGILKMVNAVHSSSLPDDAYGGNPGGFVVTSSEGNFYYAGDTALHLDMKLIGEFYQLDFAFLPIGDNFTMGIQDAIKAADFVGVEKFIGMHYDTFPYIRLDHEVAKKVAAESEKELILMEIGASVNI
jgi:L-ascorbate metabolism protein UlaG (beta-lactamase superfamily)